MYDIIGIRTLKIRVLTKTDKAVTPDVLQLEEMRRIGVEECQIDPVELTDERLLQEKKN
jgi:hypothetical protein